MTSINSRAALINSRAARLRHVATAGFALAGASLYGIAFGQANLAEFSEQRLDRVDVIYATGADNIYIDTTKSNKPWVQKPYTATGSGLSVCQNTGTRGLYCLDGNKIVNWANPESQSTGTELFNCGNTSVFAFDNDNVCTAMAVDLGGTVWIAGKKKNKFSLFKVAERVSASAACANDYPAALPGPIAFIGVNGKPYCAREYASGRPLLVDLNVVDGDTATGFPYSEGGVIGVEERKEVTFFRDVPKAIPWIVGAGRDWGLTSGEQLQGATVLQRYFPADLSNPLELTRNWILVSTSKGRLLSREMPVTPGAVNTNPVLNHSSGQVSLVAATACGPASVYDVRASVKTRAVFVSDQRGCRVLSLKSNVETVTRTGALIFDPSKQQVVASTAAASTPSTIDAVLTTFPQAISIAPGVEVNLRDECSGIDPLTNLPKACPIVGDGGDSGDIPAALLKNVTIDTGTPAGLTVFQIQNIPDCRYLNFSAQPAECKNGAILAADGRAIDNPNDLTEYTLSGMPLNPEMLFLNVTPLLPPEVTKIKPLPPMLVSPRYMALASRRTFDALFGVTDAGVRFRGNFQADFYLNDLLGPGVKLGCGGEDPSRSPFISLTDGPQWDILLTISENFTTVGGLSAIGLPNGGRQHTDMLVNKPGCDPFDPPGAGIRWSMYIYGTQMAMEKVPSRTDPSVIETRYSDSIHAKLVLSQFADLGQTIDTYACVDRDGGTGAPISSAACSALQADWSNTYDKLTKCVESSTEPLNSTEIRACNAFEIQYEPFKTLVDDLTKSSTASDPANRVGEVKARLEVFRYVYDTQFKPSIPAGTGFEDPLN